MESYSEMASPNSAETPNTNFVEVQDKDSDKKGNRQNYTGVVFFEEWLAPSLELLDDAQFGKVLREFFQWVWYKSEPNFGDDTLLEFAFRSILAKAQKNLEYYESIREKRRKAGRKGAKVTNGRGKKDNSANSANADFADDDFGKGQQRSAKVGITDTNTNTNTNTSVSIECSGGDVADKSATLDQRKKKFAERIKEANVEGLYPNKMLEDFYNYWTEMNEKGVKMRYEKEKVFEVPKRLKKWAENERNRIYKPYTKGSFNQEQQDALIKGFMTANN